MEAHKIGRYEIKSELGRGGMATVFHAHDPRFRRDVALKVLPREFLHDPTFRVRFEREAQTIAALEHSAIVPVYDFGEEEGQLYLVMRFLSGGSLADRLKSGPLPIEKIIRIVRRVGAALDEAHKQGIIHRDLKPDNILFDQYDDPFITDFGIAKLTEAGSSLTATRAVIGTPAYMSPEQVNGEDLDGRSDLYALGIIIFQMLTGRLPYEASTPVALLMKHITEPVPNILDIKPDLPPDCAAVLSQALAKEREERYSTAADLAAALAASLKVSSSDETGPDYLQTQNITQVSVTSSAQIEPDEARSLEELLGDLANPPKHNSVINQLAQMGDEALRPLVETLLRDDSPTVRYGSARALGRICEKAEIKPAVKTGIAQILAKTLTDPDPEVRYWAAEALGKFERRFSQRVIEPLTALLNDPVENVRRQAQRSLQRISGEQVRESLTTRPILRLRIGESGREIEITLDDMLLLGRTDPANNIYPEIDLTHENGAAKGVSRNHARISYQHGSVTLEDLGSANGTYLSGKRLAPYSPEILQRNDQIRLGALLIEVEIL
jgi:serine/threonine-protein kinase